MTRHRRSIGLALVLVLAACSGGPGTEQPATSPEPATPSTSAEASPEPTPTPEPGVEPIGPTEIARVLAIVDGDTIRIDRGFGSERLRYIGIDTPEVGDPGADMATVANARLVDGMGVILERDVNDTDEFGRLLRYVWIDRGSGWTFVNLELARLGYARAATFPPDVRYADLFVAAEQGARDRGVGLWTPTPAPTLTPAPTPSPAPTPTPATTTAPAARATAPTTSPGRSRSSAPTSSTSIATATASAASSGEPGRGSIGSSARTMGRARPIEAWPGG